MMKGDGGAGLLSSVEAIGKEIVKDCTDCVLYLMFLELLIEIFPDLGMVSMGA